MWISSSADSVQRIGSLCAQVIRSAHQAPHFADFVEVGLPMLQVVHSGAGAGPFVTHSNSLDVDMYLRIAAGLYGSRAWLAASSAPSNSTGCSATSMQTRHTRQSSPCPESARLTLTAPGWRSRRAPCARECCTRQERCTRQGSRCVRFHNPFDLPTVATTTSVVNGLR